VKPPAAAGVSLSNRQFRRIKPMKTLKLVSLLALAVFSIAIVPSASARGLSYGRSPVVYCRPYVAYSRPLSLFTLGTGLAAPRCYTPRVAYYPYCRGW
jgi:hypothetical protein